MHIRNAAPEDTAALADLALRSKAYWGYSEQFMRACRAELLVSVADICAPTYLYRVAENAGQRLGFYALLHVRNAQIELDALFIEPDFIGQGIGRRLMDDAQEQATLAGCTQLIVQGDPNAEPFYRKAGGILSGHRESDSIPGRLLPTFIFHLRPVD